MRGLILLSVLLALAYVQSIPVDNVEQEPAQVAEDVKDVDKSATAEDVQEVGKHHHNHHSHDWDHHSHHDWDHHNHHDDHHDNHDHHHDNNDNHQPDPSNLCAAARADRWHLPYPKDTHKFVKCDLTTGKGTVFTCPSGLVFNPAIQVCAYA
ncbi:high-affinity zinc uptake system protein ZnuA [Anabrus simplex]|uniref:high-affinity zinc uptake system protein ZnuA n=1 Tax=Anabrus simplex TaxID=316456 RepID=UPI0035A2D8B1